MNKAKNLISLVEQEPVSDKPDFNQALQSFIFDSQGKIDAYFAKQYDNLNPPALEIKEGGKRIHIIEVQKGVKGGEPPKDGQKSSWALVDKETGDVFKPASWGVPAKGARANIYDRKSWSGVGPYGPEYLKKGRRPSVTVA